MTVADSVGPRIFYLALNNDGIFLGMRVNVLANVGAYLAAHVAFGWLARRYLIVSGAEYLLLGILLGAFLLRRSRAR